MVALWLHLEAVGYTVKSRYPFYGWVPVRVLQLVRGLLGGVGSSGSSAGVGEGTVFTGSVMTGRVGTYEMFPNTDLHPVTNDRNLNLTALVLDTDVVVLPGETHVPRRIHLPGH